MNERYRVWVECEKIGDVELTYLFVKHGGSSSTGIRIENAMIEIPKMINVLH